MTARTSSTSTADTDHPDPTPTDEHAQMPAPTISVGAGIAITGMWLAGGATTVLLTLIMFVWSAQPSPEQVQNVDSGFGIFLILLLLAAPMIAAWYATKLVLAASTAIRDS